MNRAIIAILVCQGLLVSSTDSQSNHLPGALQERARRFYSTIAQYSPFYAGYLGIHEHDTELPDISVRSVKRLRDYLRNELDEIDRIDTTGWSVDDHTDYSLYMALVKYAAIDIEEYVGGRRMTSFYAPDCLYGIYYLMARPSLPFARRADAFLERMRRIPDYLENAIDQVNCADTIADEYAQFMAEQTQCLIRGFSGILLDSFPGRVAEILSIRDQADWALGTFILFCRDGSRKQRDARALGRKNYDRALSELYLLEIGSDSIRNIAETVYSQSDSMIRVLNTLTPYPDYMWGMMHDVITTPPEDSTIIFCQTELDRIKEFLDTNHIVTVPSEIGKCVFLAKSDYGLFGYRTSDFIVEPGRLDRDQSGYYFFDFQMLTHWIGDSISADYFSWSFRMKLVCDVIPGEYFQKQIALRNPSFIRKASDDYAAIRGWELYIKEQLIGMGLMGENPQCLIEFYKEIREYALGAMIEIDLHCRGISPDAILTAMADKYDNKDDAAYAIKIASINPFFNSVALMGWQKFKEMRAKAENKEGGNFSLREFHDHILSEGCIPPALIARKYGWE